MSVDDSGFDKELKRPLAQNTGVAEADAEITSPSFGGGNQGITTSQGGKYTIDLVNDKISYNDGQTNRLLLPSVDYIVTLDGSGDFADIQEAINVVHDKGSGTILIKPGIYEPTQKIVLYNNITLLGSGAEATIIDFTKAVLPSSTNFVTDPPNFALGTIGTYRTKFDEILTFTNNSNILTSATNQIVSGELQPGDTINCPLGVFKIATIISPSSLTIDQTYKGNTITGQTRCRVIVGDGAKNIYIANLTLRNGTFAGEGAPLRLTNALNCVVDNCRIYNWSIYNSFSPVGGAALGGIVVTNTANFRITNNIISNITRGTGIQRVCGILSDVSTFTGIIQGNLVSSVSQDGLIFGGIYSKIVGNYFSGNGGSGIYLLTSNNSVLDNTIIGHYQTNDSSDGQGINVIGSENLMRGNQIANNAADGIHVAAGSRNIISQNILKNNGANGIYLAGSAISTIISDNNYNGNSLVPISDGGTNTELGVTVTPNRNFVQSGQHTSGNGWVYDVNTNVYYEDTTLTFPVAFAVTPIVVVTPTTSSLGTGTGVQVYNISASSCVIRVWITTFNPTTNTQVVEWIAIGQLDS